MDPLCEISSGGGVWAQRAPEELACALAEVGEKRQIGRGERLFSFNQEAGGVYLILSGSARAVLPGDAGRELVSLIAGPGSLLGVPSALCSKRYQFDVEARETLDAAYLKVDRLNELLSARPELGMQVMTMMCDEMTALRQTREHLSRCQNKACGLHGYCHSAASIA